jgi:curli biogenesis system outer membrane secretion channel CsgG
MSTAGRLAVLVLAAAVTLGGCRAAAAAPTAGPPAVTSADPLGSVETRVDQIEKQVDHDGTH